MGGLVGWAGGMGVGEGVMVGVFVGVLVGTAVFVGINGVSVGGRGVLVETAVAVGICVLVGTGVFVDGSGTGVEVNVANEAVVAKAVGVLTTSTSSAPPLQPANPIINNKNSNNRLSILHSPIHRIPKPKSTIHRYFPSTTTL